MRVSRAKAAVVGLGIVGIVALAALSGRMGTGAGPDETQTGTEPGPPPGLEPLPRLLRGAPGREGEIVALERPGRNRRVTLAVDDVAFEDLLAALAVGNAVAFARMRDEGSIAIVPSGTRAQTLVTLTDRRLVRILEGEYQGHEGWVQEDDVHPTEADAPDSAPVTPGR